MSRWVPRQVIERRLPDDGGLERFRGSRAEGLEGLGFRGFKGSGA